MKYRIDVYINNEDREEILNQVKSGLNDEKIIDEDGLVTYITQHLLDHALGKVNSGPLLNDIVRWEMIDMGVLNEHLLEKGLIEKV